MTPPRKANRLLHETSPYLIQHAHNPVDWYPWGKEALERSKKEGKPIFLSIGYSACHWCHVMERESFEDEETAKIMNEHFVNIKVDREERQDLDHIYMTAVQLITQHGGWPMSVFLTPDLQPFYGGTYFPPEDRMGMVSFKRILGGVAGAWQQRQEEVVQSARDLVKAIVEMNATDHKKESELSSELITHSLNSSLNAFDPVYGGIGSAPKFFHTMDIRLWLRNPSHPRSLKAFSHSLDCWGQGGIYDHLGGGFHRYSTDREWFAPHFEKMLYDNALVTQTYLEGFQVTHNEKWAQIARESLDFVLREMTSPTGGFYSTQDADTEGEEGKFYVWTQEEIESLLPSEIARVFIQTYEVSKSGNWEGKNILHLKKDVESLCRELGIEKSEWEESLALAKRKLLAARSKRTIPFTDTKIIVAWNGLMIDTFALAFSIFRESIYREAAVNAASFIRDQLWDSSSRLLKHSSKDGITTLNGYLDDYAALGNSLVSLYEATFDWQWITWAEVLAQSLCTEFWDETTQELFYTGKRHESLVIRPKDNHDGATPSGTSLAVTFLSRLGKLLDNATFTHISRKVLETHEKLIRQAPLAAAQMVITLQEMMEDSLELVLVPGGDNDEYEEVIQRLGNTFFASRLISSPVGAPEGLSIFQGKLPVGGKTTLYVCKNYACQNPLVGLAAIEAYLIKSYPWK